MAHIEAFILNYNGAHFLPACLSSLANLDIGDHTFEYSVVDNGSTDDSSAVVRTYPQAHFLALNQNLGFSKGNNQGVLLREKILKEHNRTIDYVVFLNNDTVVEKEWLCKAVENFERDLTIGVVGSKSLFYDKCIEITFEVDTPFCPADFGIPDSRDLGVFLSHRSHFTNIQSDTRRSKWVDAYRYEEGSGRWLKPKGRLLLAVADAQRDSELHFVFDNGHPTRDIVSVTVQAGSHKKVINVVKDSENKLSISVPQYDYRDVIQNAGSFVNQDWSAGDIGMYELDSGRYDIPKEIPAVCGVSMFLRFDLFKKLGGFDPMFFAYYEDTDLSLRARLAGYTCWYEPKSILRHIHCGSGGEFSHYFNENVTWSHLYYASRWMDDADFNKLLAQKLGWAGKELRKFFSDFRLYDKPNLTSMLRYVRRIVTFKKNRLTHRALRKSRQITAIKDRIAICSLT